MLRSALALSRGQIGVEHDLGLVAAMPQDTDRQRHDGRSRMHRLQFSARVSHIDGDGATPPRDSPHTRR
jgi:hypothetical protein